MGEVLQTQTADLSRNAEEVMLVSSLSPNGAR